MSSVYSEVTATYSRDRVLGKFDTVSNTLPYTIEDIKISHNDYLVSNVYNDAITKLYNNWLYLIANAEIFTASSPTTALTGLTFSNSYSSTFNDVTATPSGTPSLSTINEVHIIKSPNAENNLVLTFGENNNFIFKTDTNYTSVTGLLSGKQAEFNKSFEFSNVVSVDDYQDFLFILDKGSNTLFKFDISGLLYKDPAIQRTGINDTTHPGRYLVKTVGGKGKTSRKNKLTNPQGIKVYNDEVYVLDNGNYSIKVYDINFNFIRDIVDKDLFLTTDGNKPVSITVDRESDISTTGKVFVLSKHGTITTYTTDFKNKQTYNPFGSYSSSFDARYYEQKNFKKIITSKSNNNILYVVTNKSIIKFYKTNLNIPIGFFDLTIDEASYERINSVGLESVSGVDNLLLHSYLSGGNTKIGIYKDTTVAKKLYHDTFYTNYFTLSDIKVKPQELVNAVTFNKTTEKLIYNHSALFESLNRKIYAKYNNSRTAVLSTIVESTFTLPSAFNSTDDFYIGLNEPLLTDIVNRPINKLFAQQESLFNLIKESYLNNNPPANISELLETKALVEKLQLISFETTNQTVTAGDLIEYKITRIPSAGTASFKIYNSTGTNFLTSDIEGFILDTNPITYTFNSGVSSLTAYFQTKEDFYSGPNKTFDTLIYDPSSGAVIDQNNYLRTTTIKPTSGDYTISLSAGNPTSIEEGSVTNFALKRTNVYNSFVREVSCNIFTENGSTSNSDYQIIVSDDNYNGTYSTDFLDIGNSQVSALSVHSTGTVVFAPNVSAVYFSISATRDSNTEQGGESFYIKIKNPVAGVTLSNTSHLVFILDKLEPLSLTLDTTISTRHSTTNYISGANIWELLSANSTYQSVSATYPISASLTLSDNLTVYSPVTGRGAIYFDSGAESTPLQLGSKLYISVPESAYIVGKGGEGGTGIKWVSGSDLTDTATISVNGLDNGEGKYGGPAISLSGFSLVEINNSGNIWGGAGGGGAGVLPITANSMDWSVLNASSGGGGGAGIVPDGSNNSGAGLGGSKYSGAGSFVSDGSDGSQTGGGSGGTINLPSPAPNSTYYKVMSGADGGTFGTAGDGDDYPDDYLGRGYTSWSDISALAGRFQGGSAGQILSGSASWSTREDDINNGTFLGSDV